MVNHYQLQHVWLWPGDLRDLRLFMGFFEWRWSWQFVHFSYEDVDVRNNKNVWRFFDIVVLVAGIKEGFGRGYLFVFKLPVYLNVFE